MIGNLLEKYDSALYGLLAPFIAPLFFDDKDPIMALILAYGLLPLGLITRPLGSLFFGFIGDRFGRKTALCYSLLGMAFVTSCIGFLPTYKEIGFWASLLLSLGRMLQSFFTAGETTAGAVFVMEHTPEARRGFMSSFFDAISIGGILIASTLVALMSHDGSIIHSWRYLFLAGALTAFVGVFLRLMAKDTAPFKKPTQNESWLQIFKQHRSALMGIIIVSGFSYTTYSLAFTLMNGYVPLISDLSKADLLKTNTLLLLVDMLLLPCFGFLTNFIRKEKLMLFGALSATLSALPLFFLLDHATISTVIFVRFSIVLFGVMLAAPYHAWAVEQVPPAHRCLILSLGYAIGSQLLGAPTSAICLGLYHSTDSCLAPGFYLLLLGSLTSFVLYRSLARFPSFYKTKSP